MSWTGAIIRGAVGATRTMNRKNRLMGYWLVIGALVTLVIVYAALENLPELYKHIIITVIVVLLVHLIDRLFLARGTQGMFDDLKEGLQSDVGKQVADLVTSSGKLTEDALNRVNAVIKTCVAEQGDSLVDIIATLQSSLAAMNRRDVIRMYASRAEACSDIYRDLIDPHNKVIRIIGISLNDFLRGDQSELRDAWKKVQSCIEEDRPLDQPAQQLEKQSHDQVRGDPSCKPTEAPSEYTLSVRLLLIDPSCFGAHLRSRGEVRQSEAVPGRLADDVKAVLSMLVQLEKKAMGNKRVEFKCRLYRLPPILFLCLTEKAAYTHQYYFWSLRQQNTPIPVMKIGTADTTKHGDRSLHQEFQDHFAWIWENASIPIADYHEKFIRGTDKGLGECAATNVYLADDEVKGRFQWLLQNASNTVWIQGVSLRAFFGPGPLLDALSEIIRKPLVDLRILLLDPDSEQAIYRSYRERAYVPGNNYQTFDAYKNGLSDHKKSRLYQDTGISIEMIKDLVIQIAKSQRDWQPRVQVRLYHSAPACFMLRVDSTILVEQYHYGKIELPGKLAGVLLGKDMPLVEFSREAVPLYKGDPLRQPFELLVKHFEFAFETGKEVHLLDQAKPHAT